MSELYSIVIIDSTTCRVLKVLPCVQSDGERETVIRALMRLQEQCESDGGLRND